MSNQDTKPLVAEKMEDLELALSYARDIVAAWQTISFRNLRSMTSKIEGLKQALEQLK